MRENFSWSWVQAQVARTVELWNSSAVPSELRGPRFSPTEQQTREEAYDRELRAVEREAKRAPRTRAERHAAQGRITRSFGRFSATALQLGEEALGLLTNHFLPAGSEVARWARRFDPTLSMADIIQACRNAWTACGLQALLGERIRITPSILGYSLLYPYSDNYLDSSDISAETKLQFSERFGDRLRGETPYARDDREAAVWALLSLIEEQYPRSGYCEVFDCLLAIHRAQQESMAQIGSDDVYDGHKLLQISCAKGGSSVLADACLARGWLTEEESWFSFEWGVLLQLGDDLQDVREDLQHGSLTLFTAAVAAGSPLDSLVMQLLNFSERVGRWMDELPSRNEVLKDLLRMSWRSLIIGAIAESFEFFTPEFLVEAERCSPFRFAFLRTRHSRLASRQGLYSVIFDAFLEAPEGDSPEFPLSGHGRVSCIGSDGEPVAR